MQTKKDLLFFSKLSLMVFLLVSPAQAFTGSSEKCVDQVFEQLEIHMDMRTQPNLLKFILSEEMSLGDFKPFADKIKPFLIGSTSFRPMLTAIRDGILFRHPAIGEFFCTAIEKNLFRDSSKAFERIEKVIHHTFLLEKLVEESSNLDFLISLQGHFSRKKHEYGIRDSWCGEFCDVRKITGNLFESAKMVTVDKKTIDQYLDFRKRKTLTPADLKEKNKGLRMNINEARLTDLFTGYTDNAIVGSVLAAHPVRHISVRNNVVIQNFDKGWTSLYQTWNLAFITGNLDDLDVFYPKLLIPKVINAEDDEYLYFRGIALWATANFELLKMVQKIELLPTPPIFKVMSEIWGKINLKYAKMFQENTTEDSSIDKYRPGFFWNFYHGITHME